jgi:hypothetical protein
LWAGKPDEHGYIVPNSMQHQSILSPRERRRLTERVFAASETLPPTSSACRSVATAMQCYASCRVNVVICVCDRYTASPCTPPPYSSNLSIDRIPSQGPVVPFDIRWTPDPTPNHQNTEPLRPSPRLNHLSKSSHCLPIVYTSSRFVSPFTPGSLSFGAHTTPDPPRDSISALIPASLSIFCNCVFSRTSPLLTLSLSSSIALS